jgi:hypothetical protein
VFSTFFRLGQTIETFRGQGIYQKAVDIAIQKVENGGWVGDSSAASQFSQLQLFFCLSRYTCLVKAR